MHNTLTETVRGNNPTTGARTPIAPRVSQFTARGMYATSQSAYLVHHRCDSRVLIHHYLAAKSKSKSKGQAGQIRQTEDMKDAPSLGMPVHTACPRNESPTQHSPWSSTSTSKPGKSTDWGQTIISMGKKLVGLRWTETFITVQIHVHSPYIYSNIISWCYI